MTSFQLISFVNNRKIQSKITHKILKYREEWTDKLLDAFLLPELGKIWKQIEDETRKAYNNGSNQYSEGYIYIPPIPKSPTSRQRAIAVLKRDAPEIAKRVIAKEISAAEGMRQAGKRNPVTTIPVTIEAFEKAIRKKFTGANFYLRNALFLAVEGNLGGAAIFLLYLLFLKEKTRL